MCISVEHDSDHEQEYNQNGRKDSDKRDEEEIFAPQHLGIVNLLKGVSIQQMIVVEDMILVEKLHRITL